MDMSGVSAPISNASEGGALKKQKSEVDQKNNPKFHDDTYLSEIDSQGGEEGEERKVNKSDESIVFCEELF